MGWSQDQGPLWALILAPACLPQALNLFFEFIAEIDIFFKIMQINCQGGHFVLLPTLQWVTGLGL